MKYLVVMEVSQKQNYIFKTNRLAEQIGASIAIREVTETLPMRYASSVEYVFAGGGKSVFEFDLSDRAKLFIKNVSTDVLRQYPGLELFMAMNGYDENTESVIDAINILYGKLEEKKSSRKPAFRFYGSGLTEQCRRTQLPAVVYDEKEGYLSAESLLKLTKARSSQDKAFEELLPDKEKYRFAREFFELGGTAGVKDYIAVVILDGNKMGKKIEKFRDTFQSENGAVNTLFNLKYKKELRTLSEEIDSCDRSAVRDMIADLARNYEELIRKGVLSETGREGKKTVLPIRPLILAGDDICFVTDVRIGIALTERLMQYVEKNTIMGLPMRLCAGIAMVKTSYPFFRAHELAEGLCHNSKGILPADDSNDESVLDFHMVQGEIEGSITEIRRGKYKKNTLTSKPFYLHDNGRKNSLPWFRERLAQFESGKFTSDAKELEVGRGVLKEYRDALSAGEEAAKKYRIYKRLEDILGQAYENGRCRDFDVIEMLGICKWMEV